MNPKLQLYPTIITPFLNNSGIDVERQSGDLYLVMNPISGDWGRRNPLVIKKSTDNGLGFQPFATLEFDNAERIGYAFQSGYPSDFADFSSHSGGNLDCAWHPPAFFCGEYPEFADFRGFLRKDEYGNLWGKMIHDPSSQGEVMRAFPLPS